MKTQINLATKRIIQKKQFRKFFLSSILFFGVSVLATVLVLIANFGVNLRISSLTKKASDLDVQISRKKETRDSFLLIQERLGQVRSLLSTRKNLADKVNVLLAIFPNSIEVKGMQYSSDSISISISSKSLQDLQTLMETDIQKVLSNPANNIQNITVGTFKVNPENLTYDTSFGVEYVDKSEKTVVKREIKKSNE